MRNKYYEIKRIIYVDKNFRFQNRKIFVYFYINYFPRNAMY